MLLQLIFSFILIKCVAVEFENISIKCVFFAHLGTMFGFAHVAVECKYSRILENLLNALLGWKWVHSQWYRKKWLLSLSCSHFGDIKLAFNFVLLSLGNLYKSRISTISPLQIRGRNKLEQQLKTISVFWRTKTVSGSDCYSYFEHIRGKFKVV